MNYECPTYTPLSEPEKRLWETLAKDLSPAQKAALKREIEALPCEGDSQ